MIEFKQADRALKYLQDMDEENGLVTCGNAILGGSTLKV